MLYKGTKVKWKSNEDCYTGNVEQAYEKALPRGRNAIKGEIMRAYLIKKENGSLVMKNENEIEKV